MKIFSKMVLVILLCFNFFGHNSAQSETTSIELNTPLSFEVTSSEGAGTEHFFSYEGKAGEHLVIFIMPSTVSPNDVRGTLEVRRSDGSNLNRNFSIGETIWYLPNDDTYTIYVASTTPDNFEITISNPIELTVGEVYEGEVNSLRDQFFIVQREGQMGFRMQYNEVDGSANFQTLRITGRYMGYPESILSINPTGFETLEIGFEESETPFYLIEMLIGGSIQEEYETSTFTLEAFSLDS